ncbi:MlaD family protein [Thiohalomonas denitrificans]|uniref:Phospholipid/cholesterol/gamma-HCH transport system substrate-binding protein n=1 Tax=Thiohalomonas denitrificans TaxID=415747 RepID=A0A1G5QY19_9GAMM|nr:MlaD family protein [Thiohalomonas denitrificans]SCZ66725.1 phospholipid/cholesterol/gamma-HCH transport system substrate-binding protein [Thiohalomonas denitrificans]
MEPRVNYMLVGLFVILLGGGLGISILWFAAGGLQPEMHRYVAFTSQSVDGLNIGAPVTYHGVSVGRVANISLDPQDPQRVRLLLEVKQDTPVKEDTEALIEYQSYITGLKFVNLTGGSPDSPPLTRTSEQHPYPVISTRPSLTASLEELLPELMEQLRSASVDLARITERTATLLSEDNLRAVDRTLANLDTMTGKLAEQTRTLGRTLSHTEQFTARANEALPSLLTETRQAVEGARQAMETIDQAASGVGETTDSLQAELAPRAERLLGDLSSLSETLNSFTRQLERSPSMLLFGREPTPGPGERP